MPLTRPFCRYPICRLPLVIALVVLFCTACQTAAERDAKLLAADNASLGELNRINAELGAGKAPSQRDIDALNAMREKYPASADLRTIMIAALNRRQDWGALEKVLAAIPDGEKTDTDRLNRARMYVRLGRFQEASDEVNTWVNGANQPEAAIIKGQANFFLGNLDESATAFDAAWEALMSGKRAEEIAMRGIIFFRKGENDKAVETLTKALEFDGQNLSAISALGQLYAAKGDITRAEAFRARAERVYEELAAKEKKNARLVPLIYQLEDAFKAKNYNEVINTALQILPIADEKNKGAVYQYLAQAYQATGRPTDAQAALAEAEKLKKQ